MRNHLKVLYVLSAALVAVPTFATAQQLAYASKTVSMRAGPSRDYPVVATLGSGTAMTIYGCLQGYTWCDVVVGASRGWVYSGNIVYPYQGRNVPVMSYGSSIGLGIVSFSMGNYWDNYYTDYPWYPQRQNWASRPWAGYGSGYGSGYDWRAPSAHVRPVTPRVQQVAPQGVPRAQVQGVDRPLPPGQARRCGSNNPNC